MKASKDALRTARGLFRASFVGEKLDQSRVKKIVDKLSSEKPRDYLAILHSFGRMIRLELDKSHAVIESATKLDDAMRDKILSDLKKKYGDDLTSEFKEDESLLGGLRVKVGSDVWDGTVKARIGRLEEAFKH